MVTQLKVGRSEELNKWLEENHEKIEVIDVKFTGSTHYGTSILVIYKKLV